MSVAIRLVDHSQRAAHWLFLPLGLLLVTYQITSVWVNLHGAMQHYVTHLTLLLVLASLIVIGGRPRTAEAELAAPHRSGNLDCCLALLALFGAVVAGFYFYTAATELEITQPFVSSQALLLGLVFIAAVLLLTGLLWGWVLAGICTTAVLYFLFGHHLPSWVAPAHQPQNVVISYLSGIGGPRGIMSYMPLSADMIFLLLVYGGLLHGCRVIDMFGEVGKAIGNLFRGGVAYSAVVASLLIGTVTGQAVSNIALSGVMTIPTMKRSGFTRAQAGAIEVLASTGSQLLPPIMGLGAFLMAVILGVSYIEIVIAAIIPGLLYVAAVCIAVYALISASDDIPFTKATVDWRKVGAIAPSFLISFSVLLGLLVYRYSPAMAGFWGGAVLLGGSILRTKPFRPGLDELFAGLREGIAAAVQLGLVLAAIGLVVQTLTSTGTGVSLGRLVSDISGDNLAVGLFIAMIVSLVIGMGLPTPAAYALIAIVVTPSLIDLGLDGLSANMFGFYFAIFSALTPPVAVGVLTASRISGAGFAETAMACLKLGGVCFLVPYLFIAAPGILVWADFSLRSVAAIGIYLAATAMLAGAIYGALGTKLNLQERIAFLLAGPGLLLAFLATQNSFVGLCGPVFFAAWIVFRILRNRKRVHAESFARAARSSD